MIHEGGCHCGNLRLTLRLSRPPQEVRLRACGCSFCRAHATRTTSDPLGSAEIRARDWDMVEPYRLAHAPPSIWFAGGAAFTSARCARPKPGYWAVINTNSLTDRALFTGTVAPVDHDAETTEARMARRTANWTPAILHRRTD